MARNARSAAGRVTIVQVVAAFVGFVLLSALGGVLVAGLLLPVATVAGTTASNAVDLFDELEPQLKVLDRLPEKSDIFDRNGELIATFYQQNRVVVPLEQISPWLQIAVVATEDRRFFEHNGVDGEGLMRALYVNYTNDDTQGASTLTQQLIKNTLIAAAEADGDLEGIAEATEVSSARKLREIKMALNLESRMAQLYGRTCTLDPVVDCGKEKILEQYLNIAQFGISVYGAEAAAQRFFSKPAAELTALEAATMAGITQNPSKWDPTRVGFEANTVNRRDTVLFLMWDQGEITEAEYNEYIATPLEAYYRPTRPKFSCVAAVDAPFFCDYVTKVIKDLEFEVDGEMVSGADLLYTGGLEITTTLDLSYQRVANKELRKALKPTDKHGFANALVSVDPRNGEILAMAQNKNFDPGSKAREDTAINYAVDREYGGSRGFSPGSTFKPIVLTEWLNSGHYLSEGLSGDIREWEPEDWTATCLEPGYFNGSGTWKPGNTGNTAASQQTALSATANSVNTAYVAMIARLDLCAVRDTAEKLGFKRADGAPIEAVPSMVLGTQNASPLTMAVVASTIANDGVRCDTRSILSIKRRDDGFEYPVPPKLCRQTIRPEVAKGVQYAMTQVMESGSGKYVQLDGGRDAAGKTGTSQQNMHTWFMGFVPQLVTVTWLGNPDRDVKQQDKKINGKYYSFVYGSTIAGPTWQAYMNKVLKGEPKRSLPNGPPSGLGGFKIEMPDVLGEKLTKAKHMINDAGLRWAVDPVDVYTTEVPAGRVVYASAQAGDSLGPGQYVTIALARNKLPGWFTNWPASKNPCKKPKDWWGNSWPPPEFESNPPVGWDYSPCLAPPPSPGP